MCRRRAGSRFTVKSGAIIGVVVKEVGHDDRMQAYLNGVRQWTPLIGVHVPGGVPLELHRPRASPLPQWPRHTTGGQDVLRDRTAPPVYYGIRVLRMPA